MCQETIFLQSCSVYNKQVCEECRSIATWYFMSGGGFYCDDCVSRNCECNWMWYPNETPEGVEGVDWQWVKTEVKYYDGDADVEFEELSKSELSPFQYLDEKRRPYPCCEYDYSPEGYSTIDEELNL